MWSRAVSKADWRVEVPSFWRQTGVAPLTREMRQPGQQVLMRTSLRQKEEGGPATEMFFVRLSCSQDGCPTQVAGGDSGAEERNIGSRSGLVFCVWPILGR